MRTRTEAELGSVYSESSDDEDYQSEMLQYQLNMNLVQDIIERVTPNYRVVFSDLSSDMFEAIVVEHVLRRLHVNGIRIYTNINTIFRSALQNVDTNAEIYLEELTQV